MTKSTTTTYENVPFSAFVKALRDQFKIMENTGLYKVGIDKTVIYDTYLNAFPEGTNEMFKERREYDCNCCKSFIRNAGRVVTIVDGKLVSIWDVQVGGYYQVVADAMAALVKSENITDQYFHYEKRVGVASNVAIDEATGKTTTWSHFSVDLPASAVMHKDDIATHLSDVRSNKDVLLRSLVELTVDAGETVSDLMAQGSLYRGEEKKRTVDTFLRLKREFDKLTTDSEKENFAWVQSKVLGDASKIRNDAIGTLLTDLSEGMELEDAVKRWEKVMAPTNYKRPTALVSQRMIQDAQNTVAELGIENSLQRRYATENDLNIGNVLFADRSVKKAMNVFDDLTATAPQSTKSLDKTEEIGIDDFLAKVLPKAATVEVLVENAHKNSLVSVIAPVNADAPNILRWNNNFSWSYNGEVTDSIKERVKAAGGRVEGALRVSLSWSNSDDLDLHLHGPKSSHIWYRDRVANGARLDLDMNGMDKHDANNPVENIIWADENKIDEGIYKIVVNQYSQRMTDRVGFVVEMEFKGQLYTFNYPKALRTGSVEVMTFKYSRANGVEIINSIGHTKQSQEVWGINTEQFQKVRMVLNSPNHWDGEKTGNKHVFFVLEGCKNPDSTRGLYNEYLSDSLNKHRKVFEVLGSKLKVTASDEQLSGVGFSSTQRNHVFVKVTGSFTRTLKVLF